MKTIYIKAEIDDDKYDVLKAIMAVPKNKDGWFSMSDCEIDGIDQTSEEDRILMFRDVDDLVECGILVQYKPEDMYKMHPYFTDIKLYI